MIKIRKALLTMVSSITVFSAWAQDGNRDPHNDQLVVTSNDFLQPTFSVLAASSVVTRNDIERWQAKSVLDVMLRLPGVSVTQNGGLGQISSVFIRGNESRHVLLLINGIRLNQAGGSGAVDLSQFPVSLIQRVEFVRGARSAVYGSDAIGGVINIITTHEENGTQLWAGVGTNNYQTYDGATQQKLGERVRTTLAANYTYTRGYDLVAGLPDSFANPAQSDRDSFMSKSLYGEVQYQFSKQASGFVRGYGYDNRTAYDGLYNYRDPTHPDALPNTRQLYNQSWEAGGSYHSGNYATQFSASYSHSNDYNYDAKYGPHGASSTLDDATQYYMQWNNTFRLAQGSVSSGVDWREQKLGAGSTYISESKRQHNTGVYLTILQQIKTVTLESAVRGDNNSQFGWYSTWQTSAAWEFREGYRAIASYGTAFKASSLGQLYAGSWANPVLKPEESEQWEVGFEGVIDLMTWQVLGYRNNINNLIDYVSSGANFAYYNVGQVTIKGVEVTSSFETGSLTHKFSYDYLDPRDIKTGAILLRRSNTQIKYELNWQIDNFDWTINYQYLGKRYDKDYSVSFSPTLKLGGVSLWDLAVAYPLTRHLKVHGRIANLFNKDYETAYGYATPGREYYLTGSYTF